MEVDNNPKYPITMYFFDETEADKEVYNDELQLVVESGGFIDTYESDTDFIVAFDNIQRRVVIEIEAHDLIKFELQKNCSSKCLSKNNCEILFNLAKGKK